MSYPWGEDGITAILQNIDPSTVVETTAYLGSAYVTYAATSLIATSIGRAFGVVKPRFPYIPPRLPWRGLVRVYMSVKRWQEQVFRLGKQSSGGFASVLATVTNTYQKGCVPLGLPWIWGFKLPLMIGLPVKTHLQVIGMSGAGKSVWLKGLIAEWDNSAVIIDAKDGEITRDLSSSDKRREWVKLDPYAPDTTGQINVMDSLEYAEAIGGESEVIRVANRIGQAFIEDDPNSRQQFFIVTSRGYLVGIILFVYVSYPKSERHLGTVRDLIVHGVRVYNDDGSIETTEQEASEFLHKLMTNCERFSEAIAGAAAPFINASPETYGNLKATLQERTKELDIPSVRKMLEKTTRPLHELKTCDDYVLAIKIPVSSIKMELKSITRVITNMVLYTFEVTKESNGQCLLALDEFNAQGYNSAVEAALPVARSQKLVLVILIQDLEGLQAAYVKTSRAYTGNSTATVWMSTAHPMNLNELSRTLGKKTIIEIDHDSGRKFYREVNVADPDQLARFLSPETGNIIVTRAGARALRLKLDPHYMSLPVWKYTPDPDHKEAFLRRLTRTLLGQNKATKAIPVNTTETPLNTDSTLEDDL